METINAADGDAEAIICRPSDGQGPWPGVLLCMDAIGLRPQIEQLAQRIADAGFVVLAPNTFYRAASAAEVAPTEPMRTPEDRERFFRHVGPHLKSLTGDLMDRDAPAYVAALRAIPGVMAEAPIGVVGYCMGVRLAIRAAGLCPDDVAAVAGFHGGGLVTEQPNSPHERLGTAKAEFVLGHADHDRSMTAEHVRILGEALKAAGLRASNEIYTGAPHGFTMADTPSYDAAAAERARLATEELFRRVLTRRAA